MIEKKVHSSREYKIKKIVIISLSILLLLLSYLFENASYFLSAVAAIEFLILFYLADHFLILKMKFRHYIFATLIAVLGLLLSPLFFIYPNYDKFQHFVLPIMLSSMIFYLVSKLNLKLKWKIFFTASIVIAILGLFEVGEYSLDRLFDMKLQGVYLRDSYGLQKFNLIMDPIDDTMVDLVLGTLGTLFYSLSAYFYNRAGISK